MQANKSGGRLNTSKNPFKAALLKLWYLPDSFNWMEPLPYAHRRGVLLAALLILVAFLWPNSKNDQPTASDNSTPVELTATENTNITPEPAPTVTPTDQAEIERANRILNQTESSTEAPLAVNPQEEQQVQTPPPTQPVPTQEQTPPEAQNTSAQTDNRQWKEFTIQQGHTLTQLFRENNFIVTDAFLLAQVEGPGKPVNALRIGQKIKVQLTNDNQVTALEIELAPNRSALFTRKSNGRFQRDR